MSRYAVPLGGLGAIVSLALVLIVLVVLRPWSGPDRSWDTHLNLRDSPPSDYTRSASAWVAEKGAVQVWRPRAAVSTGAVHDGGGNPASEEGHVLYIARGCASCHGLDASGGVFAKDLPGLTGEEIREAVRDEGGDMPYFSTEGLSDGELSRIIAYLTSQPPPEDEEGDSQEATEHQH